MKSNSQLGQDLWVLEKLKYKKNGFFIEAGACDGIILSNTLLLEKEYGWNGICCEPNNLYFSKLIQNRNCFCDNNILYDISDFEIDFYPSAELGGTLEDFQIEKNRIVERTKVIPHKKTTISLNDLLEKYNAPKNIDYMSLDTEGSELKILKNLDFSKWNIEIFSIEHNTAHRNDCGQYIIDIYNFLKDKNYDMMINQWDSYFYKI